MHLLHPNTTRSGRRSLKRRGSVNASASAAQSRAGTANGGRVGGKMDWSKVTLPPEVGGCGGVRHGRWYALGGWGGERMISDWSLPPLGMADAVGGGQVRAWPADCAIQRKNADNNAPLPCLCLVWPLVHVYTHTQVIEAQLHRIAESTATHLSRYHAVVAAARGELLEREGLAGHVLGVVSPEQLEANLIMQARREK